MKPTVCALVGAGSFALLSSLAQAQNVTDAQIASIVVTANQVDIDGGKLAESQAQRAEQLQQHHEQVDEVEIQSERAHDRRLGRSLAAGIDRRHTSP